MDGKCVKLRKFLVNSKHFKYIICAFFFQLASFGKKAIILDTPLKPMVHKNATFMAPGTS